MSKMLGMEWLEIIFILEYQNVEAENQPSENQAEVLLSSSLALGDWHGDQDTETVPNWLINFGEEHHLGSQATRPW